VSADVQEERLARRAANPWRRVHRDEAVSVGDPVYIKAFTELMQNSDTRWSPWKLIDADDERRAAVAALEAIADAWTKAMPAEPPHIVTQPRVA
jgi:polyphosphate kinase 2 (PPK2 family)